MFPLLAQGLLCLTGCGGRDTAPAGSAPAAPAMGAGRVITIPPGLPPAPPPSNFDAAVQEATRQLTYKCAQLWGTPEAKLPSRKAWVSYDEEWLSRADMDFGQGEVRAQALADSDTPDSLAAALAKLRQRLADAQTDSPADMADDDDVLRLARDLARKNAIIAPAQPSAAPKTQPVLADILPPDATRGLTMDAVHRMTVTGDDGKKRVMLTYRVKFPTGYFLKLAARYTETVRANAQRYDLLPSLILSVTEAESAFNPRARSAIPAYGLMQVVPNSAGRDAAAFAEVMAELGPEYLYIAENNIRLGTAYLKLLDSRYLGGITDPESRRYATIAGYNTGAGNVARAFSDTTDVGSAVRIINKLSPEDVLQRLKTRLPYEETRNYVVTVLAARDRYTDMDAPAAKAGMAQ
jgi:membrane-bound lytic murein transglycosylase C